MSLDTAPTTSTLPRPAPLAEAVEIPSQDRTLRGVLFAGPKPRRAIMINGATGIKASYYKPFAEWLASDQNAAVLVWDYRDFGSSGDPRHSDATMTEWAVTDPTAVHHWLAARFPDLPRWCIGHSLGGMALAFQPDAHQFARVITIGSGQIHTSEYPLFKRIGANALWHLLGPIGCAVRPYFPGRALGLGNNLPKGVFWQWRKWLIHKGSLPQDTPLGGLQNPGLSCDMTIVGISDDELIAPRYTRRLANWSPNARVTFRELAPQTFGLTKIGHLHAFSPRNKALWPALIAPA